jgi:hypothetical protein
MLTTKVPYVYIEHNKIEGTNKDGKPYVLRKLKIADPRTFENHTLDYAENADLRGFGKGEQIILTGELHSGYRDSRFVVTALEPSK